MSGWYLGTYKKRGFGDRRYLARKILNKASPQVTRPRRKLRCVLRWIGRSSGDAEDNCGGFSRAFFTPQNYARGSRAHLRKTGIFAAKKYHMRDIKLSGREAAVVRAIGFAESMLGAEILDSTRMELEDVGDTLNGLIASGFVETIPYAEQVDLAEMPATAFEVNPAYVHELRLAIARR